MTRTYEYFSHGCQSNVKLTYRNGLLCMVEIEDNKPVNEDPNARFLIREEQFIGTCAKFKIPYTEVHREITFDMFWDKYAYKVDKPEALAKWNKLTKLDQKGAFDFIPTYNTFLIRNSGISRKMPKTYLHNKTWQTN